MKREPNVPAAEVKRLDRIRELGREHRRAWRALERAILAALARGISVRKVADAAGLPHMNVWRMTRPGSGQPGLDRGDVNLPGRPAKPKDAGK